MRKVSKSMWSRCWAVVLFVVCVAAPLAGCGGQKGSKEPEQDRNAARAKALQGGAGPGENAAGDQNR